MQNIINLKNIAAYREDTRVFDDLSLQIPADTNTVILGPNGAGKSTLLQLLTRKIYPVQREQSSLKLFGKNRWSVWELRDRLGIVSQDLQNSYTEEVPGQEVVLSGFYSSIGVHKHQQFSDQQRAIARAVMETLDILPLKDRAFKTMSTGQQRRFLLGRALVNDPNTLILDEPTNGLDLKASFQYLRILRRLMRQGKSVILATHHIHEIPPEISNVVLIKDGQAVAHDKKEKLLTGETLSELFETSVELVEVNGYFQAVPGEKQ